MYRIISAMLILVSLACCGAFAQETTSFNYQGKLTNNDGTPVPDGSYTLVPRIFPVETGGTALWQGSCVAQTTGGAFAAVIGPLPLDVLVGGDRWLEITINGSTLSPRTKLLYVPYAGYATMAKSLSPNTPLHVDAEAVFDGALRVGPAGSLTVYGMATVGALSVGSNASIAGTLSASTLSANGGLFVGGGSTFGMDSSGIVTSPRIDADSFRDRNDTTYLVDPASSSRLKNLTVDGTLTATLNPAMFDTRYLLNTGDAQTFTGDLINTKGGNYANPLLGGTQGLISTAVFSAPYYYGPTSTASIYVGQQNPVYMGGSLYVPRMYDGNNTAYYVDPASTSKLSDLQVAGDLTVTGTINGGAADSRYLRTDLSGSVSDVQTLKGDIDVRDALGNSFLHPNATSSANWTCVAAPVFNSPYYYGKDSTSDIRIGESNPVRVGGNLYAPRLYDGDDSGYYVDPASTSQLNVVRGNIFYDKSDTSYYLDPADTSRLNNILIGPGSVSIDSEAGLLWQADTNYGIFREAGAWTPPYPDLRIAFHTGIKIGAHAAYGGTRFYNSSDMNAEIFSVGDGDNDVRATGSVRAPKLIDSNNTAYYLDPASTSHLNDVKIDGDLTVDGTEVKSPIAYAYINSTGSVASGTSNVSCTWNSTDSRYEISISGESYLYSLYVTNVTVGNSLPRIPSTASLSGKLLVTIFDLSGNKVQNNFQFTTYKP